MRFVSVEVSDFGCIDHARIELGPGLNVLYGPNDLGKSTLAHGLRAALLLLPRSTAAKEFKPWHSDAVPRVVLDFVADDGRTYRLDKSFGGGTRGQATLHWSNDGREFSLEAQGRSVDGRVRELLGWGLPSAGGRSGARGIPDSFLSTALLGRQAQPGTVFDVSLEGDADDSARERLGAALQALAQDSRFKEILDHAQAQVDLAFRADGSPRRHKDSPFRKVGDRIKQLDTQLRELEARVLDTDDVRTRLCELDAARDEASTALDDARARHGKVQEDLSRAQARAQAQARVQRAEAALQTMRDKIEALAKRRDELHAVEASRPEADNVRTQAEAALRQAQAAVQRAQTELEHTAEGGDAAQRLKRQSLLTRQAEATSARQLAHEQVRELESAQRLQDAVEEIDGKLADQYRQLERATVDHERARTQRRTHEARRRSLEGALALRRFEDAKARRTACEAARDDADRAEAEATKAETEARAIHADLAAQTLPTAEVVAQLEALANARELAAARLGGGLSVFASFDDPQQIETTADDDDVSSRPASAELTAAAQRRLRVRIAGVGEIEILAGSEATRDQLRQLEARWSAEATPILAAANTDDLATLEAAVSAAADAHKTAQTLRARAAELHARAEAIRTRAEELDKWTAAVAERERGLAGYDRDELARIAGDDDEDALRNQRIEAETAIAGLQSRIDAAAKTIAQLEASRDALTRERDGKAGELVELGRRIGADPVQALAKASDELAAAEGKLEQIGEELAELDEAQSGAVEAAQRAVDRATEAAELAAERFEAADTRRQAIDRRISELRGAIELSERDIEDLDVPSAEATVATAREDLAALPAPSADVDEEAVAAAEHAQTQARARLRQVEAELRKTEGALESVGGQVVRDKAAETRAALDGARRTEHDIELDYEGWKLLVETMRETENEEGNHLGQALVDPIARQIHELTAGRYGALQLGPDLEAHGVSADGQTHEIDAFSVGLQEQFATLLRLTVAKQLGSALVLDDHLTQTDPARIAWFGQVLRAAGAEHQIVVLTCRPSDYLAEAELPNGTTPIKDAENVPLRAVDLSRVIERAARGRGK